LFAKCNYNDEVKDDEMGRACSTHVGFWWESQKEGDHLEDLDVDGRLILKWDGMVWTGFIWLWVGNSSGLL
jgi:hypothetical protein